jgi:hypothetical protein
MKQEKDAFEASLDYIVRLCLKKVKQLLCGTLAICVRHYSKAFARLHSQAVYCQDSDPVSMVAESMFLTTMVPDNC